MMEILRMVGNLSLFIILPILYIAFLFLLIVVARWIYMLIGVIIGDKNVIDEFDCRDKEPYWIKVLGFQCRQDKRYPPTDNDPHRPRDWRRRR